MYRKLPFFGEVLEEMTQMRKDRMLRAQGGVFAIEMDRMLSFFDESLKEMREDPMLSAQGGVFAIEMDRMLSFFDKLPKEMREYWMLPARDINGKTFSLKSSDHVVFEMKKSVAMSQSVVLGDLFDCIPNVGHDDEDEIPVQVPSLVLSNMISFCHKNTKFNSIIETIVQQLIGALNRLKGTVHDYKTWITGFVKSNKPLFSHLHQAADYLHIPALLELTSISVEDMKESSVQEISDWYAGLSIPRMLSPLGIQAYSTLSQLDFFS